MPDLSIRLKAIADLVPKGAKVCDIGTDHSYLAIYLADKGIASNVIATDLNEKPLERARQNIRASGVFGIELRLCDGLSGINPNETDTVIIAGMGGEVISGILEKGSHIVNNSGITLLMQPTTSPEILREFLCKSGFEIIKEIPVAENGKVYSVMLCRFTGEEIKTDEGFYYVGKVKPDCEEGMLYIEKQKKRCLQCMTALEGNEDKKELYLHYKNALMGISLLLDK